MGASIVVSIKLGEQFCVNKLLAFGSESKNITPTLSEFDWSRINSKSSPSRAFSDLFWMSLHWAQLQQELKDIHALDTGCGAGNYGLRFQSFSGDRLTKYKRVDSNTNSNWGKLTAKNSFLSFSANDSKNIYSEIPDETNLFLSQSAIEHFDADLTYFRGIRKFVL